MSTPLFNSAFKKAQRPAPNPPAAPAPGIESISQAEIAKIDVSGLNPQLKHIHFEAACDVDNPLTGPRGASAVFGPQKGANSEMRKRIIDITGGFKVDML